MIYSDPTPKFDRNIAVVNLYESVVPSLNRQKSNNLSTITKISDELWDNISGFLPDEKSRYAVGRPIILFRKVMEGILYVLRTDCQWKMILKEFASGSIYHSDFSSGLILTFLKT